MTSTCTTLVFEYPLRIIICGSKVIILSANYDNIFRIGGGGGKSKTNFWREYKIENVCLVVFLC